MPLSGSLKLVTPAAQQTWRLSWDATGTKLVELRALLKKEVGFADLYALVDSLMQQANSQFNSEAVEAYIPDAPSVSIDDGYFDWDTVDYAAGYDVEMNGTVVATGLETTSYSFTGSAGERFVFRARAFSDSGYGSWSSPAVYVYAPDPVGTITPSVDGLSVKFEWDAVPGATAYKIYGAFSSGVTENSTNLTVATPYYTRTINSGQTLYIRVAAINTGGSSGLSEEVSQSAA